MTKRDPVQPADEDARRLARNLLNSAKYAALGVLKNGQPFVSRIALTVTPEGEPLSLISDLSMHSSALKEHTGCSLLVGEPEARGDPLTHPRITLEANAIFIDHDSPEHPDLRTHYLTNRPKSKLYIDFADFRLVRFDVRTAFLNGGFGRAYKLSKTDVLRAASSV